ncbi:MAG: hypothetical protein JWQ71_1728 [Pedosphaera sp.]|nr:hypothetical protein [Pedosphaera sp.]
MRTRGILIVSLVGVALLLAFFAGQRVLSVASVFIILSQSI